MARTFFELPNDLLIDIFNKKAELDMDEKPDLYMTNHHPTCYSCGNYTTDTRYKFNGINYKYCSFCWGGPVCDSAEEFTDYVNEWQTGDWLRMEKMYHQSVAPDASEETWSNFWNICLNEEERTRPVRWIKDTYERYLNVVDRYSDIEPDTPPGNEYIIDWGESDIDVES